MKRSGFLLWLGLVLLGGGSVAEADGTDWISRLKIPMPKSEVLPNGLTLVWFFDSKLPVMDAAMLVQSGYRDDLEGKSGTAQLLSAMLDRGAGGLDASAIAKRIESLGASRYISTDEDTFTIGVHGFSSDVSQLLEVLSLITLKPDLPLPEIKKQKDRLLERWDHIGDQGQTLASLAFHRMITSGTSYARGGFYTKSEFEKIQTGDLVGWHRRHFVPKNSVLMLAGQLDSEPVKKKIVELFGGWKGEAPLKKYQNYSNAKFLPGKAKGLVVNRKGLTQAQVRIGFRGPSIHDPDYYALAVANALLGEYFNSRLNAKIRDELGLTYSIGSSFSYSKDLGLFTISSSTRNERVAQLIVQTIEILRKFKSEEISPEEVVMAKDYLIGSFPLQMSTVGGLASRWLAGYVFQLGPNYLGEYIPKIDAVQAADVSRAVKKHFQLSGLMISVAGDSEKIQKTLVKNGLGSFKQIEIEALK